MNPTRLLVLPLAAALLASCGGSSVREEADDPTIGSPTPGAVGESPRTGGPTGTSSPVAKVQPGGDPTPLATGGAAIRPKPGGDRGGDGQPDALFTPPGSYNYDSKGTVTAGSSREVSGTQVLKVDPPAGNRQHSSLQAEDGGTEMVLEHRAAGSYLAQLSIGNSGFKKEFKPAKPVLAVPAPAKVGSRWSWRMTSTDGKTTAANTSRITKTEILTIGGTRVRTAVIESTLVLSGDIDYTDRRTTYHDESRLLQVKQRSRGNGKVNGFAFTTDVTSVLRSLTPR